MYREKEPLSTRWLNSQHDAINTLEAHTHRLCNYDVYANTSNSFTITACWVGEKCSFIHHQTLNRETKSILFFVCASNFLEQKSWSFFLRWLADCGTMDARFVCAVQLSTLNYTFTVIVVQISCMSLRNGYIVFGYVFGFYVTECVLFVRAFMNCSFYSL